MITDDERERLHAAMLRLKRRASSDASLRQELLRHDLGIRRVRWPAGVIPSIPHIQEHDVLVLPVHHHEGGLHMRPAHPGRALSRGVAPRDPSTTDAHAQTPSWYPFTMLREIAVALGVEVPPDLVPGTPEHDREAYLVRDLRIGLVVMACASVAALAAFAVASDLHRWGL